MRHQKQSGFVGYEPKNEDIEDMPRGVHGSASYQY